MVDALLSVASQMAKEEDGFMDDSYDEDLFSINQRHAKLSGSSSSVRQCEFCKSTETPAWRRGPSGKGSLCNACGIKWRLKKKVKKSDSGPARSAIGKTSPGQRKSVGRPPKKHPKLVKPPQFRESQRIFCKSCNLSTDVQDYGDHRLQFSMLCRNCSKKREDRLARLSSSPSPSLAPQHHHQRSRFYPSASSNNVTIDHSASYSARRDRDQYHDAVSRYQAHQKPSKYAPDHDYKLARDLACDGLETMHGELYSSDVQDSPSQDFQSMDAQAQLAIEQELELHEDQLAAMRLRASRELSDLKAHAISRIREFERLRLAQVNAMVGSLIANISACEQFQEELIARSHHL